MSEHHIILNSFKIVRGGSMNPKIDEKIKEEHEVKIKGKFKIYLGDELYTKGKNRWTRFFSSSLLEMVISNHKQVYSRPDPAWMDFWTSGLSYSPTGLYTARAGNDTSTPTTPDMTDLVSKIDIAPNTQNVAIFKEPDYSKYMSRHVFTWSPGTIPPQTVGEFGVYLWLDDDSWTSPAENPNYGKLAIVPGPEGYDIAVAIPLNNPSPRLGARIASADGDFDPINYTSEEAIRLEWYVTIRF